MTPNESKKFNFASKLFRISIPVILLSWIIARVGPNQVVADLRTADLQLGILSMAIFQFGVTLRAFRWWILLRGASIYEPFGNILGLTYVSELFIGAFPFSFSGDLVRIIEFKHRGSRVVTAGVVILDRLLGLMGLLLVALGALVIGYGQLPGEFVVIIAGGAILMLLAILLILQGSILHWLITLVPKRFSTIGERWFTPLAQAVTGASWRDISSAIILSIINTAFIVLNHYLVALAVGIYLGIGLFFIFSPAVNLSVILPTISGLGVREIGYQLLLEPYSVPASTAVALGIGVYISRLSASLIGGVYYLLKNLRG